MGTIAEKLEYLDETRELIRKGINSIGGELTTSDTFRSYTDELEEIYQNLPKISGSGETLSLTPTIKGKMKVDLKGNTYQYSTTGKNFLQKVVSKTVNGVTFTVREDNTILVNGTATGGNANINLSTNASGEVVNLQAGNYVLSGCPSGGSTTTYYLRTNIGSETQTDLGTGVSINVASAVTNRAVWFTIYNGYTANNLVVKPMLRLSNTTSEYEPYTNGASPNPDYPQDIQVVSGDNTINVVGQQLFQSTYLPTPTPIPNAVLKAGTYTIASCDSNNFGKHIYFRLLDMNNNLINESGHLTSSNVNITFSNSSYYYLGGSESNYITFTIDNDYKVGIGLLESNSTRQVMLVKGNEAIRTYQPYQSQTYPISLGNIELCKIGTYQDKIAKSTGKNLFDISTITENTYIEENGNTGSSQVTNLSDYIEVKSNTSYKLSYDYSTLLNSNQRNFVYYDENKTYISGWIYLPTNKANTITTPNNAKYIRFSYDKNCYNIMLNEGTTVLPYEPYGTSWYLNKQIGKVVLNGSNYPLYGEGGSSNDYWEYSRTGMTGGIGSQASVLTNYFNQTTNSRIVILSNGGLYFRFPKASGIDVSTNTLLNTWLSTHNTEVYYVLATPTYEEITDTTLLSQLEALAYSYEGTTNISQVNDDLAFILDVSALLDANTYIDHLEAEVEALS